METAMERRHFLDLIYKYFSFSLNLSFVIQPCHRNSLRRDMALVQDIRAESVKAEVRNRQELQASLFCPHKVMYCRYGPTDLTLS